MRRRKDIHHSSSFGQEYPEGKFAELCSHVIKNGMGYNVRPLGISTSKLENKLPKRLEVTSRFLLSICPYFR
jgi:hypothetical protein